MNSRCLKKIIIIGGIFILGYLFQNSAEAATSFKVGSFTKPIATGTSTVTGLGFQPKAVIFYWTDQTSTGFFSATSSIGFGFASGPSATSSAAVDFCSESTNAAGNSDSSAYQATSTIVILSGNNSATTGCGTLTGQANLISMDSDGFTLNWTTAGSKASIIYYAAIGGADITNTKVNSFTLTNAAGLHNETGVGFKPDFVMLMSAASTSMNSVFSNADPSFSLGFSTNTTSTQANVTVAAERNQTTADTVSVATTTTVLNSYFAIGNPAAIDSKTVFASMETDGFKLNKIDTATTNQTVHYLAIKGGQFKVGNFVQATSTVSQTISNVGFQPEGAFFMTNAASSSTPYNAQQSTQAVLAFGAVGSSTAAVSATSSIGQIGYMDIDGDTNPDPDMMSTSTTVIVMASSSPNTTPTVKAAAVVNSFDSNGFTMGWLIADNASRGILYFAIGDASAAVPTISCSTDQSSTAFGVLTASAVSTSTPNASTTMSCANTTLGCALYVQDAGGGGNPGLWNTTSSKLIASPNVAFSATTTLAINTEGYGVRATSTAAGSGTLNFNSRYLQAGDWNVNTVGGLAIANTALASSTADVTNREVVVVHKAAASSTTVSGNYNDTITYSCLLN